MEQKSENNADWDLNKIIFKYQKNIVTQLYFVNLSYYQSVVKVKV